MLMALSLTDKLAQHTICVYELMGVDKEVQDAEIILRWIERARPETFTARACHQSLRSRFPKRENLVAGINVLIERGYIRPFNKQAQAGPGRPSEELEVNPIIYR